MAQVDADDDTIWRWVIYHHRFDADRNEHRPVVVSAYDNVREYERELDRYHCQIREEIDAGVRSGREWFSGTSLHPGYRAEQARAHMVRRAMEHGVDPRPLLRDGPLPPDMAIFGVDDDGTSFTYGGGEPPSPPS